MGYNIKLTNRIREALMELPDVEEKRMFSGVCFMVNGKMCVCVSGEDLLCRIGETEVETALQQGACRQMIINGRAAKDYVLVAEEGFRRQQDFDAWIQLCLDFNPRAKASGKKR